jgi:hypothetical protein
LHKNADNLGPDFPARYTARDGEEMSTTLPSSGHWERNTHLRFTIKIDLGRPGEIWIENQVLEPEELRHAA